MLMVNHLIGFGAGSSGVAREFAFIGTNVAAPGAVSSHTFTAADLGDAGTKKVIVVLRFENSGVSVTGVTIDGVTATSVVATTSAGGGDHVAIWQAEGNMGATGDIAVTASDSLSTLGCGKYRAVGYATAASDTDGKDSGGNITLDCPANGFIIAGAGMRAASVTYTGLTETYDQVVSGAIYHAGASEEFATTQTGLTVGADGSDVRVQAFASWGP